MARGLQDQEEPPRQLRRVGGPPRKIPKPAPTTGSARTSSATVASTKAPKKEVRKPIIKHDFAEVPNPNRDQAESSAKRDADADEDDEWDEVDVVDGSAAASAPGTDYETDATGKTNKTEPDQPTGDEEDVDLEAVYGYDFHDETEAQNGQATPSKNGTTGDQAEGTIEVRLGPDDGLTPEERRRREVLALRKKPLTARDRAIRLEVHKMHVVSLLANAGVRNKWCSDDLLKARLLSLTPHTIHAAFHIPPSRIPDVVQRSRLFMTALQDLATWWANDFFSVSDYAIGIRTRSWDEVMDIVDRLPRLVRPRSESEGPSKSKGKGKAKEEDDVQDDFVAALGDGGERIRTVKSLMKKALQGTGGRDTSAQLFVSLCRALGLGTRLVVSLQPVQWKSEKQPTGKKSNGKSSKGTPGAQDPPKDAPGDVQDELIKQARQQVSKQKATPRRKGKMPEKTQSDEEEENDFEEVSIPVTSATSTPIKTPVPRWIDSQGKNAAARGQSLGIGSTASEAESEASPRTHSSKKDVSVLYKLKKVKPKPQVLGTDDAPKKKKKASDLSNEPPVFWAEVYSRPDQKWIPVDPVRGTIKRKKDFEPTSDNGPIRMLYVVAFEEDGHARDVTVRYAKNFAAKTVKLRVPSRKDKEDWWERVLKMLQRPYRLHRDDLEDAELETSQISEGMPMVLQGFKDHPLYVLERHLKREEVIMPKKEVGKFRGEPVYRRVNVVSCKTAENWMRLGRKIKFREEPLKWVKQRAVTLDRRRAQELAIQEGHEPLQQGLYAEWQTEVYRPPPIKDGIIPTNAFGNIDLYTETMLPEGAVHLPYKGIAKVAKQLGIRYAEACTGFEFKKQRAIPVITGIVVAADQEQTLLDAYWESAAAAEERALTKKQGLALKRWQKLIQGIQIRRRLQNQYGDNENAGPSLDRVGAPSKPGKTAATTTSAEPDVEEAPSVPAPVVSEIKEVPVQASVQSMEVDEPGTPLSELEEPVPEAPLPTSTAQRPMPRIKLKMPKASDETLAATDSGVTLVNGSETSSHGDGQVNGPKSEMDELPSAESGPARPRRAATRQVPASPAASRPVRLNTRARAATKPAAAAVPATRTLRSRRGDRTEEEIQKEREKAEAIRAALDSGEEDGDGIEESL